MGLTGLEPVTLRLSSACSNQLSYRPGSAAEPPDLRFSIPWFVPFSVGAMFAAFVLSAAFFRPKTLQTSAYVLGTLFGSNHVTGEFLLTTGTIALIFISLFLAVAQERSQFIDRLALQPARIQIPVYVCAFLALELFPATGPVPFVYFQF